jgi:hypothetical protein
MGKISFALTFIFFSFLEVKAQVSSAECTSLDVRDHHPHLREYLSRPLDQGPIGWCYGYAAADLLTIATGKPVSALHTSALHNKKISQSFLRKNLTELERRLKATTFAEIYEGGTIKAAVLDAAKNGEVCVSHPADAIDSANLARLILDLEESKKTLDKLRAIGTSNLCQGMNTLLLFHEVIVDDIQKITESFFKENLNSTLEKILAGNCKEKVSVPKFKLHTITKPSSTSQAQTLLDKSSNTMEEYFRSLNHSLNSGLPVGLSYDTKRIVHDGAGGPHASTIISRRWQNGTCQYKVRNTWGKSCKRYRKDISCEESEGSFWVSASELKEISMNFTILSPE